MRVTGLSFKVKKDVIMRKDSNLSFVNDENKCWFELNKTQVTYPMKLFKIDGETNKLWLRKLNNTKSS